MFSRKVVDLTAIMVLVAAGINAGLTALLGFDAVVNILGGYNSIFFKIIYLGISIAAGIVFYSYVMTPGRDLPKA